MSMIDGLTSAHHRNPVGVITYEKKRMPRHTLEGRYFKDFNDEVSPAPGTSTETNPYTISTQKYQDTESPVSSTPEEPTSTQEPETYPAIPVQKYRDGPIEEIAVHYVRINRVIEKKQQETDSMRTTSGQPSWILCSTWKPSSKKQQQTRI